MNSCTLRMVLKSAVFSQNIFVLKRSQALVPLLIDTRNASSKGKTRKAHRVIVENGGISLAVSSSKTFKIICDVILKYTTNIVMPFCVFGSLDWKY